MISDQSTSHFEAPMKNYDALYFVSGYILRSVQNAKNTEWFGWWDGLHPDL